MKRSKVDAQEGAKSLAKRYCVGSGWWCSGDAEEVLDSLRKRYGSERIRAVGFFPFWKGSVRRSISGAEIIVVDSASPQKPDMAQREDLHWVELPFNAKHSVEHLGRWSGWTRSVLVSGNYALSTEAEYFVYVEQDCLLSGPGVVECAIEKMHKGIMFGSGAGTPQPVQQSFFLIHRSRLEPFLSSLASIQATDREFSPEWKFVFATWFPFVLLANMGLHRFGSVRKLVYLIAKNLFYDDLPFGFGRARPIDFDSKYWYFQHGSEDEIEQYLRTVLPAESD